MNNRPIGVFDSGLGGLTVLKEIMKITPNENIVYFGDTARVPYGPRSKETIIKYTFQAIDFLISKSSLISFVRYLESIKLKPSKSRNTPC